MRKLKYHEHKLLKKTNFFDWKSDNNTRELKILHRFKIEDREDYHKYNKLCGLITKLVSLLKGLPAEDPLRKTITDQLAQRLIALGLSKETERLAFWEHLSTSRFCLRRLSTVLVRLKFAERIDHANQLITHGHICIGNEVVNNPAVHVTPEMEDIIRWAEGSKMKRHVQRFNNTLDDCDLLCI